MQHTLCSFCRKCCSAVECVGAFPLSLIGNSSSSSSRTIDPMNELIKSIGSMEAEKEER